MIKPLGKPGPSMFLPKQPKKDTYAESRKSRKPLFCPGYGAFSASAEARAQLAGTLMEPAQVEMEELMAPMPSAVFRSISDANNMESSRG